jgi:hypothetical protein
MKEFSPIQFRNPFLIPYTSNFVLYPNIFAFSLSSPFPGAYACVQDALFEVPAKSEV